MVDTEEEEKGHARNNKLLIEAITAKMTKLMDERFDSLRQERRRRRAHEERPQEKPNWRSRSARDEANQDYYNRDDQRCFKPAKPLPNKPSIQIDYEELNKEVLETYKALKEKHKSNLSTYHVVGTKTTKEKPSGLKEELVTQNSKSLDQPLPICQEPIVLEENDENSREEKVLTQPCTAIQNQRHLSNNEEQTENKTLKHLTVLEAKCTLSSTQPDFALDKLTPIEPVQPSSIVSFSQIVEGKSTKGSTKEKNHLWVSTTSQAFRDNNFKTDMLPSVLCGTQVSLACNFIRYWNDFTYTRIIKQPVLNVEISSIMHLIFPLRAKEDTGTFDVYNGLERIRSTRSLTLDQKEKPPDAKPENNARGNYLESKRRMKANLLSLGGDCTMSWSKTFQEKEEMSCQLEKEEFSNTLILSDFFKSCKLEYYASRNGIGTTLMQDHKPITAFCEKDGGLLLGVTKSFKVMQDYFLWPHKKKGDVERRCQSYLICKLTNSKPHGLHHSVPIPLHSWNEISIGFVKLPRIMMHKDFLDLIMIMFSKLFHFVSLDKTSVKLHHAHLIFEGINRLHLFLKMKLGAFDAFHELEHSLSDLVFSDEVASCLSAFYFNESFMLFRTESKFVWYKVFSKMKMHKFALCAFKWFNKLEKHLESILEDMDRNVKGLTMLLAFFCRIYDGFLVVFVDSYKGQDSRHGNGKARTNPFRWSKSDMEPGDGIFSNTLKYISNRANSTKGQGKFKFPKSMKDSKKTSLVSGKTDLRTNLFEEGGDDVRMDQQLEREQGAKEQLEPEDVHGALELPVGLISRPKAKKLKQANSTLLIQAESNLSERAYPTTPVVIQAN